MDTPTKNAYLSPAQGTLDISIIRDARPFVTIALDLGIPNFTVFSLKFPLVEDKPNSMSGLVAEAVHTLLDEMSAFMLSTGYQQEVIVQIYATILACFKGLSGEADTNKSMSPISKDPTVKTFEGTFKLPMEFINETYDRVVTAAGKTIQRPPAYRHLELTHDKPSRIDVNDARTVIRNYRSRSIKSQPNPMYIIVYDMTGKARGTIPLGGNFKNDLLKSIYRKKGAHTPEFTPTVKFNSDIELKMTNVEGIPKSIFVADKQFVPVAFCGTDMALYRGEDEWLVNLPDGRCVPFSKQPAIDELKTSNYPVPTVYSHWTFLPEEAIPESSDKAEVVDEQGNEVVEPTEETTPVVVELMPDDEKAKTSAFTCPGGGRRRNVDKSGGPRTIKCYECGKTFSRIRTHRDKHEQPYLNVPRHSKPKVEPSESKTSAEEEKGDCFKDCFSAITSGQCPGMRQRLSDLQDVNLVHGIVNLKDGRRSDHAWIEFRADNWKFVWEPQSKRVLSKDEFYAATSPTDIVVYPEAQAVGHAVRSGHSGPWIVPEQKRADHRDEKGYWAGEGGGASGILPICTSTGRIGLAWRSEEVHEGSCWGTLGGAIQRGMTPAESAREEMQEETGYHGGISLVSSYIFQDGDFKYYNFLGLVPSEFHLNPMEGSSANLDFADENEALAWFTWDELIKQMKTKSEDFHKGVIKLIEHSGDQIRQICQASSTSSRRGN